MEQSIVNTNVATLPASDNSAIMERVLLAGDLSKLSSADRLFYYQKVCESVGLNPLTRPFDYLTLNNKQVLYAKRDATDQLRKIHNVSVTIAGRETIEGVHIVTARAKDRTGREDEATGAVTIQGLKGDALANALMKAETKAKRRVTLSICGLGLLDETEIDDARNNAASLDEIPDPPDGYVGWKADMDAKVTDGYEAFKSSWQKAEKSFRLYANTHDKAWREAIPEKAKEADAARAPQ
jgi:hypothetical protein